MQTVLSSSFLRRGRIVRSASRILVASERVLLPCRDGIRLTADVSKHAAPAPLAILIHGWLGDSVSSYLLSTAGHLFDQGYTVARLHLRDHGGSEHLNEEMFHSARIEEVVDACNWLARVYGQGRAALIGYSLGGNFALRATGHPALTATLAATIAICPVIQPGPTMHAIDSGWFAYRHYFVRKWHRALAAKQRAFPRVFALDAFKIARDEASDPDLQLRMQGIAFQGAFFAASPVMQQAGLDEARLLTA
ncbi:MAG: alpha/beta fold hydrolase, partial [Gammaproteobacteria bacterium]|nr:alpha/beta fold hydrolase [Gammaproteobacteria bacterium]